jgi:heavy metal efflux system protein
MKKLTIIFLLLPVALHAQRRVSLEEAVAIAMERNPDIKAAEMHTTRETELKGTSIDLPKTNVSLLYGQFNSYRNDNNITVTQEIPFPTVFSAQHKTNELRVEASLLQEGISRAQLQYAIRRTFNQLVYLEENLQLLQGQDSLFQELARIAQVQYRTGEGTLLQVTAAESHQMEVTHNLQRHKADYTTTLQQLKLYCQLDSIEGVTCDLRNLFPTFSPSENLAEQSPALLAARQNMNLKAQEKKLEGSKMHPDLLVGYFSQTLTGPQEVDGAAKYFDNSTRFNGVQIGVAVPLFFNAGRARVKAAGAAAELAEKQYQANVLAVTQNYYREQQQLEKNRMSITYYETSALAHADMLTSQSRKAFQQGELDYATLLLNLRQALVIREGYLAALRDYNESTILLLLLTGK